MSEEKTVNGNLNFDILIKVRPDGEGTRATIETDNRVLIAHVLTALHLSGQDLAQKARAKMEEKGLLLEQITFGDSQAKKSLIIAP